MAHAVCRTEPQYEITAIRPLTRRVSPSERAGQSARHELTTAAIRISCGYGFCEGPHNASSEEMPRDSVAIAVMGYGAI